MNLSDALAADPIDREIRYVVRGRPGQNDRAPLPAGHPETWGALIRGTMLDGAEYPWPVFDGSPNGTLAADLRADVLAR